MIWAKDRDPDADDTFRIKIWYEDGGEVVVYDNGFDQGLDAQLLLAFQLRAVPPPGASLLIGIGRGVGPLGALVPLYLASNGRWRAIHSCCNLPERAPRALKTGNLPPLLN